MSRVLVLREKNDDQMFQVSTDERLYEVALEVVTERLNEGYYYDNWDDGNPRHQWEDRVNAIVAKADGAAAWSLLLERDDFEYEGVELRGMR